MATSHSDTNPNQKEIGNYELIKVLGRGGMGVVYLAKHKMLHQQVALKVLSKDLHQNSDSVKRFHREMKAVGELKHANIVSASDAGEVSGTHYLVMEYIEGLNLNTIIDSRGVFSPANAAELIRQVAVGLNCIAEKGMIHRDLKTSNLMINKEGEVKILDLGLARAVNRDEEDEVTLTGQGLGTADYMAPEQATNAKSVDIRSDIYSLGCTLYKLLSDHAPFGQSNFSTAAEKVIAHCQEPIPDLVSTSFLIPSGLLDVMNQMLEKKPDNRYQTPQQIIDAVIPFTAEADLKKLYLQAEAVVEENKVQPETPSKSVINAKIDTALFPDITNRPQAASPVELPTTMESPQALPITPVAEQAETVAATAIDSKPLPKKKQPIKVFAIALSLLLLIGSGGYFAFGFLTGLSVDDNGDYENTPIKDLGLNSFGASGSGSGTGSKPISLDLSPPFEWVRLLETEPKIADWKNRTEEDSTQFFPNRNQIKVTAKHKCLLSLGETKASDYQIQIGVNMIVWNSGSGIFWGFHYEKNEAGNMVPRYQYLTFHRETDARGGNSFVMRRNSGLPIRVEKGVRFVHVPPGRAHHKLPDYPHGEVLIDIEVKNNRLLSVKVGGRPLFELTKSDINDQLDAKDYHGAFGVIVEESNSTTFGNARFRLLKEK